jgi:DNA-binding CsgD family transcriptional regulator
MESALNLIGLIYEASSDSSVWQLFLDAFVLAMSARRGALGLNTPQGEGSAIVRWSGWDDEDIQIYSERYIQNDPLRIRFENIPEGAIGTTHDTCPEHVEGETYRQFYAPRDADYGCGAVFLRAGDRASIINVMRAKRDGCFGDLELNLLRSLMPHLRRAALLHGEFTSLRTQLATFTGHMDRYPYPFLLTDPLCNVIYCNKAAIDVTRSKDGLEIAAGQLSMMSPSANSVFQKAVKEISVNRNIQIRWIDIPRPAHKAPYRLLVTPVPYSGGLRLCASSPAAAVLIIDTQAHPDPDVSILREVFSLTPAEARVTGRLSQGQSADEIARQLGVSVETVRTHIRRALSKTATGRQGELISLVLRTAPFRPL